MCRYRYCTCGRISHPKSVCRLCVGISPRRGWGPSRAMVTAQLRVIARTKRHGDVGEPRPPGKGSI